MTDEPSGTDKKLLYEELTEKIIGAAIEVHRALGPGLLESVYERALCHELTLRQIGFKNQIAVPLVYKGLDLQCGFRLDLLIEGNIILELKSVAQVLPVHEAQLLTYMKLTNKRLGFIMNFNVAVLKQGITRRVL
jgi:GxxExxY protein